MTFADECRRKRDLIVDLLDGHFEFTLPEGGYLFPKVPDEVTASEFVSRALHRNRVVFPGFAFNSRNTHFRIGYWCDDRRLQEACGILRELAEACRRWH